MKAYVESVCRKSMSPHPPRVDAVMEHENCEITAFRIEAYFRAKMFKHVIEKLAKTASVADFVQNVLMSLSLHDRAVVRRYHKEQRLESH